MTILIPQPIVRTCLVFLLFTQCPASVMAGPVQAISANDFLNSIGTQSAISVRGENFPKTRDSMKYLGVRWMRAGVEGNVPIEQFVELHRDLGVRFSWGLGSGSSDLPKLLATGRQLAAAGALLAFEGVNEPNNWGIHYEGKAGGRNGTWMPVALLQNALYRGVKSDPLLRDYPVWSISEAGAETDNVGLQYLTIPPGAKTLMPPGTQYADYVNVHNYIYHPNSPAPADNKTWNAADPGKACKVDGLYGEHGVTWAHHYAGYSDEELKTLPRVTTETGTTIGGAVTERLHGLNLITLYLDQFKRGWSYTAVYLLRDRVDEGGNQKFGFFRPDYTPRPAAVCLHNLTSILEDKGQPQHLDKLDYSIPAEPETVHDILLEKSDRTMELVVWGEKISGSSQVMVMFGKPQASLAIYDPTSDTSASKVLRNVDTVPLSISDHPVVIELKSGP